MFGFFRRKKAYLIEWSRDCFIPNEQHKMVVRAKCETDACWKFLQKHNAKLEQLEIKNIEEVGYYG